MRYALEIVQIVLGVSLLYWGSLGLVHGSAGIARGFGVKPLVVGLTMVAYGTSAPELAVATKTALANAAPIALGTVIGSCIANISLILGITAVIRPPTIDNRILRRETPVLLASAIIVPILLRNGELSRGEGIFLIACAVVFTIVTLTISARLDPDDQIDWDPDTSAARAVADDADASGASLGGRGRPKLTRLASLVLTVGGLALLVVGSELFVRGGRKLGADLGMSERMLGLTVIAVGTSLPELISSIVAATRGHAQLAIGNVIGSNLLNVFLVLGITAYLRPIDLRDRLPIVDLVGLVVITLLGVIVLRSSRKVTRIEGFLLIAAYFTFTTIAAFSG